VMGELAALARPPAPATRQLSRITLFLRAGDCSPRRG
jgi:hypothetical protein